MLRQIFGKPSVILIGQKQSPIGILTQVDMNIYWHTGYANYVRGVEVSGVVQYNGTFYVKLCNPPLGIVH